MVKPNHLLTINYTVTVNKFASALKNLGVKKGDRITIYLPMVPELPIAMLACARIGAIHTVVFSGFSAQALSDRVNDSNSKIIITADGGFRRGKLIELKRIVDETIPLYTVNRTRCCFEKSLK